MILGSLWKYLSGGLLFLTLILGIALHMERVHGRKLERRNTELVELRKADRASYEAAQAQAQANNQAQVHKIEAQHEAVTDRIRTDYRRDLDRLRAQSGVPQGSAGGAKAPGVPQAPGGAHADGVPPAPCDHLCASEIELRLLYLQNWIADQLKVDPNSSEPK